MSVTLESYEPCEGVTLDITATVHYCSMSWAIYPEHPEVDYIEYESIGQHLEDGTIADIDEEQLWALIPEAALHKLEDRLEEETQEQAFEAWVDRRAEQ